jgi:hypothetical protein
MFKKAFKIEEPKDTLSNIHAGVAGTLGRINAIPAALLAGQEKAFQHLQGPDKKFLEKELAHLKKDPRLKDVIVRLGHSNLTDNLKRIWNQENSRGFNSPILKVFRTIKAPIIWANTGLRRADHYDVDTNTVGLYSGIPEVAHHELGHARDFNNSNVGTQARLLAHAIENQLMPGIPGPTTQFLETKANEEAEKGYKGDMREFRRRLWPARGTYWGALAGGAAYSLNPSLREKINDYIAGDAADYSDDWQGNLMKGLRGTAAALAVPAAGALAGRLFAETRNLFDRDGKKEKRAAIVEAIKYKLAKEILSGGEADKKKDSEFPAKELAKGTLHEKEHTSNDQMAREIAKDHLIENKQYYTKLEQTGL